MSAVKITKEMYQCQCERAECGYKWDSEIIPLRCPKCKSRRWNRVNRLRGKKFLTLNGETMNVSQWAKKLGLSRHAIMWRFDQGWPIEQVLSKEDWRVQK